MKLNIGDQAPAFELLDQDEKAHKLSDYLGKKVVLYFYPKDQTPGCTVEACDFRDNYHTYLSKGFIVFGVSPDDTKSHKKFEQKFDLPFPLLADPSHATLEAYGVWGLKKYMGREYLGVFRTTFVIDEQGKIEKIFENVKPEGHAAQVLDQM